MFFTSQFVKIKNKLLYSYDHNVTVLTPLPVHFAVTFFYFLRLLFFGSPYYIHTHTYLTYTHTHTRALHIHTVIQAYREHTYTYARTHSDGHINPNLLAKANGVFVCV